jgi:RimJ/RimL family protein N-acetyltransferase
MLKSRYRYVFAILVLGAIAMGATPPYFDLRVEMPSSSEVKLFTPNLVFGEYQASDADSPFVRDLFETLFENPTCARFLNFLVTPNRDTSLSLLKSALDSRVKSPRQAYALPVRLKGSPQVMGHGVLAQRQNQPAVGEVGWGVIPAQQGHQYGLEIAAALVAFSFGTLGLEQVVASIHPENEASISIARKLGFVEDPERAYVKKTWVGESPRLYFFITREVYQRYQP